MKNGVIRPVLPVNFERNPLIKINPHPNPRQPRIIAMRLNLGKRKIPAPCITRSGHDRNSCFAPGHYWLIFQTLHLVRE